MKNHNLSKAYGPVVNRISDVMMHSSRFAFRGSARLAYDAGVHPSSVSRLLHGEMNPTFLLVARLTDALEREFGFPIDPRNIVAESGRFLTRFACGVVGCRGCYPYSARDEFERMKPEFQVIRPGEWVTSAYPGGFVEKGGLR